jgi:hypothetical protein
MKISWKQKSSEIFRVCLKNLQTDASQNIIIKIKKTPPTKKDVSRLLPKKKKVFCE